GVAWSTKILPVRITNTTDGLAYVSDAAEGIRHAADRGAKVVNLSYRMAGYATIADAGQYLRDRGGLLFVAAGNDGIDPGWADYASFIAIGATSSSDTKASFSNTGTYIDVVAPGVSVYSTTSTSGYTYMSGTSFSSPIAAGLAALIYSVNPAFTPDQVENFIFSTCVDLGDPGEDGLYGHGRIDAAAAIAAAAGTSPPPPPNTAPVAVATATPTAGTAPLTVALDGSGSSDADGTITAYQWDLGDGTTATTATVSHVYDAAGTHTATLTVTDDQGATATDSVQITVAEPPPPPEPQAVLFVADIEMALKVIRNRTYATATVTIVSIDGAPCPNATVAGTWTGPKTGAVSGTTGADGTVTLTSPLAKDTFTYTFTVTSVAATNCTYEPSLNVETSDSISNGTTTNAAPEAVLLATPTSGVAPLLVELDASGSSDPDGTIVSCAWDFGDGTTGASAATTHTYLSPGTYTVTLTVTDDKGAKDTATETIVVVESTGQTACVSSIALSLLPAPGGYVCQAVVKIVDGTGAPIAGAEVIGEWSGLVSGVAVATTGADGTAVFTSKKSRKSGAFTFTVTDVSAAGYAYDPANNTESSDTIASATKASRRR
ncbi:S8 family serine peptidase, partial [bacterium]|nr:S8 family serine peptidase [bacterium]